MKATFLIPVVAILAVGCSAPAPPEQQSPSPQPPPTTAPVEAQSRPVEAPPAPQGPKRSDALILKDFADRVGTYVKVHKQAAKHSAPLKETKDSAKIVAAENDLADKIRAERASAKAGDIFTTDVRDVFRRLLHPEIKGDEGHATKEILKDDAPASLPLKVNANYPEGAALPTVPPNLLLTLPTLPEELEYRIIGRNLILRDTKANIIVDYIPNVIR